MDCQRDATLAVLIFFTGVVFVWLMWFPNARTTEADSNGAADLIIRDGHILLTSDKQLRSELPTPRQSALLFRKVPVNTADDDVLQTIPGIGPALAARITAERERGGSFSDAGDLARVPGIGRKRAFNLKEHVSFE